MIPPCLGSRWVRWELGYADGEKAFIDLVVLPISESMYREAPNEYIQVCQRIVEANNGAWYVFEPGKNESLTLGQGLAAQVA